MAAATEEPKRGSQQLLLTSGEQQFCEREVAGIGLGRNRRVKYREHYWVLRELWGNYGNEHMGNYMDF